MLALAGATLLCAGASAASAQTSDPGCVSANVPVRVAGLVLPYEMHGILCEGGRGIASTVMVLVPGATYNHTYWDFPYEPDVYNFREAMNRDGYATFTVDRLGTGGSSRPLSVLVTATLEASAVHSVVQALRAGRIGGHAFARVILGGHSLGSLISILEAGTYHDVNAVLLTGVSHAANVPGFLNLIADLYPAFLDPAFAGRGYDPGYLTTRPGTRRALFYAPGTTAPGVVAEDEATKDVASAAEAPDGIGIGVYTPYSRLITAPVLLVDGQYDSLACGPLTGVCSSAAALRSREAPYYSPSACLRTYVLAGAGHDVNLATDTQDYQQVVAQWADTFVGYGPERVTPPRC